MRIKADLTLFLVAVIWGSAFVAQRVAGQLGSVYYFNGARYLLAALIVFPFAFRNRSQRLSNPLTKEQYAWMFIAGLLLFLGSSFRQAGLVFTTAGNAGFITSLYVVLIPVFLILFWSEGRHWLSIVAVVAAGVGAFLLSTAGEFKLHTGDLLELIGASFWAFHVIVLGKYASKFDALSFSVGQLVICGLLNLVPGFFVEQGVPITWPLISAVLYTALFSLGLCYTLQIWAQRHTPPADAALILSLESVFAVLSGWLLLDERLVAIQIIGCVLIFAAVVLSQFREWTHGGMDHDHTIEGR